MLELNFGYFIKRLKKILFGISSDSEYSRYLEKYLSKNIKKWNLYDLSIFDKL
jgi:hypothetical protein